MNKTCTTTVFDILRIIIILMPRILKPINAFIVLSFDRLMNTRAIRFVHYTTHNIIGIYDKFVLIIFDPEKKKS